MSAKPSGGDDREDDLPCGRIICNNTFQYCSRDVTGDSECWLCSGICARSRVGTNRRYIERCLETCPRFWQLQLEREQPELYITGKTSPTTAVGSITLSAENVHFVIVTNVCVSVTLVLLMMAMVYLLLVRNHASHIADLFNKPVSSIVTNTYVSSDIYSDIGLDRVDDDNQYMNMDDLNTSK